MWGDSVFQKASDRRLQTDPIFPDRDLRMARRRGASLPGRRSSRRCYSTSCRRRERVMAGMSAFRLGSVVFWFAVVLEIGAFRAFAEDRSGRVLSGVSAENSIDAVVRERGENVTLVFGKSVSDPQCNDTLCSVPGGRPKRFKARKNGTLVAERRGDFGQPSRGLLPPYESVSGGGLRFGGVKGKVNSGREALVSYSYPKPQQDEPTDGYAYPKPQQDQPTDGYDYPKPQHDQPTDGYNYPKPQQDQPTDGYDYPKPQHDQPTDGYNYPKPQQDQPSGGYNYPKPQQDEPTNGYKYPKPQQDVPTNGYNYPKPQQDEPMKGYNYPKPQLDDPVKGYNYPKPQQDEPTSGYSYPKPQQDEPTSGYSYPKPQQDEPTSGYSYPKPQQDEPTSGYSYPKPQQDEPTSGYSYPKPQQDEPTSGYSYPKPQQDEPAGGYSYPKPQQDEPIHGYSYQKPKQGVWGSDDASQKRGGTISSQTSTFADVVIDDYRKRYAPGTRSQQGPKQERTRGKSPISGVSAETPWKPMASPYRGSFQRTTTAPFLEDPIDVPIPPSQAKIKTSNPTSGLRIQHDVHSQKENTIPPNWSNYYSSSSDVPHDDAPDTSLVPPKREESQWKLYGLPSRDDPPKATYGPPLPQPVRPPQEDPTDSYLPPKHDDPLQIAYGPPRPQPTRPSQEDPGGLEDSYLPPERDPEPLRPTYGVPKPRPTQSAQNDPIDGYPTPQPPAPIYGVPKPQPTRPPQEDPADSYLPPQNDPKPPSPTYGSPRPKPTRPPQEDPTGSYLPPQNHPIQPNPTYGPPQPPAQEDPVDSYLPPQNDPEPPSLSYGPPKPRPTRPPQHVPEDSYLPPQNDPLPNPSYGPPKPRPTRPPQEDPADSYFPPQKDPKPPSQSYGPPKPRPTRPPQEDPSDSYFPPQKDPKPPSQSYGPPKPRPTHPPQEDPADSYFPPQNEPKPPSSVYGPPKPRPTRPPQNDPADSYLPPQYDQIPRPTYGPPKPRPTRPPQEDPTDSYLPPQNDPKPPPSIYGPPKPQATRPPQADPINSYLPPQNDPAPPRPTYGPPKPQDDPQDLLPPPEENPKPPAPSYGPPQELTTQETPSTSYLPEVEDNRSYQSPPLADAPSGSYDDSPSPVYIPYELPLQEDAEGGSQRQVFPPIDSSRQGQTRVLRVPGGLLPNDIHVTDLRCWRSTPTSVFAFTLWTTKKMAAPPVLITAESGSICKVRTDPSAPRSRYLIRLANGDLSRCGVRPCSHSGEERMCVTLQLPQLTGLRLASDPQLEVSCAPPPASDWSLKQLRMAAAAPVLGPPELRIKGGRSPMHSQLQLFRRSAPAGTWRRLEASQAVILGEELQLRAVVRGGDGWQSSKLGDVTVRRSNSGEDLKSSAALSDSTSAISARLVSPEGCPNPDMEDVTGLQSWLAGDPLVSALPIRVFMFRGQKDGEQLVISARVTACQDRLHCRMDPQQCEAANAASRVRRSVASNDSSYPLNESDKVDTTSWESEISLRVVLPSYGSRTEPDAAKPRGSLSVVASSALVLAASVVVVVVGVALVYRRGLR